MVTDASVRVERVGRAALRRSFRRRSLKRCAALFVSPVSPDSETAALQCGRPVSCYVHPPGYMDKAPSRVSWADGEPASAAHCTRCSTDNRGSSPPSVLYALTHAAF